MSRKAWAAALISTLWLSGAGLAAATEPAAPETPQAGPSLKGTVGVCVRWGADDHHVEEAVVVKPSGNAILDATIPDTLRALTWARPPGDTGAWTPLNVSVDGAPPAQEMPSCEGLTQAGSRPAPEPAAPERPLPVESDVA